MGWPLFYMLVFPGFLFLVTFAMLAEYVDRKLCAMLQNRVGPPWFQPWADMIKLGAKEDLIPQDVDRTMFKLAPLVSLTAVATAMLYIPVWGQQAAFHFSGDLIVVLYLLTIPTVTFFLAGWYSRSVFSMIGAVRSLMQLFAYEVPLFLAVLAPALLAGTWSLSEMTVFYGAHPALAALNVVGLVVAMIALLGKLEKVPFDIPEAETEIVAGTFTEYSGRLLGMFRLAIDIEMVVGATLIAAVFLPFGMNLGEALGSAAAGQAVGIVIYLAKVLGLVCAMSLARSVFARLRIDQMINFCWQIMAPVAFVQLLVDLVAKGLMGR
jgi:NADH-quinone oxidoreductase subunit H